MRAVVIPFVCLTSMNEERILMGNVLDCILASPLGLGLSILLANRRNNGKEKELIMRYCYIVFRSILLRILSSLQIAFYSVV